MQCAARHRHEVLRAGRLDVHVELLLEAGDQTLEVRERSGIVSSDDVVHVERRGAQVQVHEHRTANQIEAEWALEGSPEHSEKPLESGTLSRRAHGDVPIR